MEILLRLPRIFERLKLFIGLRIHIRHRQRGVGD